MTLLNLALSILPRQRLLYQAVVGYEINEYGIQIEKLAPKKVIYGSFQPVDRATLAGGAFDFEGLDMQRRHFILYTDQRAFDLYRDQSGDYLEYDCRRYKILSRNNWYPYDGWMAILCVDVGGCPE